MSGNEKTPPCRTFRLCHKQLQIGIFFKETVGGKEKRKKKNNKQRTTGACSMDVQDEYVDGSSLEVTMQKKKSHLVNKSHRLL